MKIIFFLITFVFIGCSHHGGHKDSTPEKTHVKITKELTGNSWGTIYFSAQPTNTDFQELGKNDFKTIINLRGKIEEKYRESSEAEIVQELGMNYYNIPFTKEDKMTDEYVEQVTSKVMKHRKEGKILIHCSSGDRVAIWLGAHFKKDHKFSNEKSLKLSRKLGLTKVGAENKLKMYLNQ